MDLAPIMLLGSPYGPGTLRDKKCFTMLERKALGVSSKTPARIVVAVDFGFTCSGFAYACSAQPEEVRVCYDWPAAHQIGAQSSCKTHSSLFYAPSPTMPGRLELQAWGWPAFLRLFESFPDTSVIHAAVDPPRNFYTWFRHLMPKNNKSQHTDSSNNRVTGPPMRSAGINELLNVISASDIVLRQAKQVKKSTNYFVTGFSLANHRALQKRLPCNLTIAQIFIDFIGCLSKFILSKLRDTVDVQLTMADVQWCFTVPGMWNKKAKEDMRRYAEQAGIVQGPCCPKESLDTASRYPLHIVLESEVAAFYCQQRALRTSHFHKGDKLLVADVGEGSIDLVVHENVDDNAQSFQLHKVVPCYSSMMAGGMYVDSRFFKWVSQKIGCFKDFCHKNMACCMSMYAWWQDAKTLFDGDNSGSSVEMPLPLELSNAWAAHDKNLGIHQKDEDYYKALKLDNVDIASILDPEVQKVVDVLERHIDKYKVRLLMVVGGFAASPYLKKTIQKRFKARVDQVMIPDDPTSLICQGTLQLHVHRERLSKNNKVEEHVVHLLDDPSLISAATSLREEQFKEEEQSRNEIQKEVDEQKEETWALLCKQSKETPDCKKIASILTKAINSESLYKTVPLQTHKDIDNECRISMRTYGFANARLEMTDYAFFNYFDVIVRVGERVPLNASFSTLINAVAGFERKLRVGLYSSFHVKRRKLVTYKGVEEEGSYTVDLWEGLRHCHQLLLTTVFGASLISVSVTELDGGNPARTIHNAITCPFLSRSPSSS